MSILVRFHGAPSVTEELYDEATQRVEASGEFPPNGLEFHCAFRAKGTFCVSEVWESREAFDSFGQRLMPILSEVGIELAGEPEIIDVYNIIKP
jgi:quinol monooxygenase YgiN